MKTKLPIITVICLGIILVGFFNAPPDGHTGAPGDSLCTACHGGSNPFGFDGGVEISGLDPVIIPGTTYTVSVIVSNPNGLAQRAGFQIVALDDNNVNIGTMSNPSANSTLSTQGGRTYFKHNPGVNFPGSNEVEWTVEWTAPSMTDSETVTFYGAGNIADGNGANTNDFIVTTNLEVEIEPGPDPLVVEIISSSDVSCFGGFDGMAEAQASGGEGSYSYLWSSGETGPQAVMLGAGMNSVTVTDDAGTSASTSIVIGQPDELVINLTNLINVSCFQGTDGAISVSGQGGVGSFSFNWSNGASGQDIFNLSAGSYSVILTDGNNCTASQGYTISEPDPISVSPWWQDVSCGGMEDGEISLIVSGGASPYTVVWSNGSEGLNLTDLAAGDYFYTLTDANDCEENGSVTVDEPDEISVSPFWQDVSCKGMEDGEISLVVSGGASPYTVVWSNGSEGLNLTDLAAGDYLYTLTDANDCEENGSVTVGEPDEIELSISFVNPSCPGCNDGSATVTAVGGDGNFSYIWNTNPPQNTAMASNLTAGSYTVTVTDGNNCEMTAMVNLTDPGDCITEGGFYYNQNEVHCTSGSLQNLCFEIQESSLQDSLNLCDTTLLITNPFWYNFVAGDSLFHILAGIGNCSLGDGLRIAVFELDCSQFFGAGSDGVLPDGSLLLTDCEWILSPQSGEIEIEVATSPGKIYGLMIEGWEDDQCTFEVLEVFAAGDAPELDDGDLGGLYFYEFEPWNCDVDELVVFFLEQEVPGACTYIWTKENLNTGEFEIIQNSDLIEVSIHFNDYGHYNFCVAASNICDTTDFICIEIQIISPDPFFTVATICKRSEYSWIGPFGEVLLNIPASDSVGDFQFDTIAVSQEGCEVESFLNLHIIDDNIDDKTQISAVICRGEGFQMPDGSIYTETGFYGEDNSIFITQASEPGATYQCDSFFTLDLIVLDIEVFWEDPVCLNNQIFIIADQSISPNPSLLPGFGGEEIDWQWVRVSDGETIASGGSHIPSDPLNGFIIIDVDSFFNDRIETFQWHVQMTYEGQPDEPCYFIAGSFRIDLDDFYPATPNVNFPPIVGTDNLITMNIVPPFGQFPPDVEYIWEIDLDPEDYIIVNDSSGNIYQLIFLVEGTVEICVSASNECGLSEPICFEIEVEFEVSTEDPVEELYGMRVFPNPAEDFLIIDSEVLGGDLDIRIYDSAGKLVLSKSLILENRLMIELKNLAGGMYFIHLTHEKGRLNQLFYKN